MQEEIGSLSAILFTLFVGLFLVLFSFRIGWLRPLSVTNAVRISGGETFFVFALFFIAQIFLAPIIAFSIEIVSDGVTQNAASIESLGKIANLIAISLGFGVACVGLLFIPTYARHQLLLPSAWSFTLGVLHLFILAPLVWGIYALATYLLSLTEYYHPTEQIAVQALKELRNQPLFFFSTVTGIIFLVPFTEEVLFRGFLQNWIKRRLDRPFWAIGITSVIFSVLHLSYSEGINNLPLFLTLFSLSCFLGYLYEQERTLWASIGLHSAFNAFNGIQIFFV